MAQTTLLRKRPSQNRAVITIDGSYGEGGGQILRTSASLAAITGEPVRIERVRAGRAQPGLKAQHLTAIQAAMRICNGHLEGAEIGATEVTMTPGSPVQPGRYAFDIGTAGSIPLVLQTLMLPLLRAEGESHVTVRGGTHNTNAPSSDFLLQTFLPAAGLPAEVAVERVGFFPKGGGTMTATLHSGPIAPIVWSKRGERVHLTATVTLADALPASILDRAQAEIERRAKVRVVLSQKPSFSPGMAVHLDARYEGGASGFTALGRKGVPTERIVEEAFIDLAKFEKTAATVDERLADQLVLPTLFADGRTEYRTSRVTEHLRTMAWLVPQFGIGHVEIDEAESWVRVGR